MKNMEASTEIGQIGAISEGLWSLSEKITKDDFGYYIINGRSLNIYIMNIM